MSADPHEVVAIEKRQLVALVRLLRLASRCLPEPYQLPLPAREDVRVFRAAVEDALKPFPEKS